MVPKTSEESTCWACSQRVGCGFWRANRLMGLSSTGVDDGLVAGYEEVNAAAVTSECGGTELCLAKHMRQHARGCEP